MTQIRCRVLAKGLATYVPGLYRPERGRTGGTSDARYCYSIWLRHLVMLRDQGLETNPSVVAELGPGDSLGIGLAALLSGASSYVALDVVRYAQNVRNLQVLEELVHLFERREPIPGPDELPEVKPFLEQYAFPHEVLDDTCLQRSLAPDRVWDIRRALRGEESGEIRIRYCVPWSDPRVIERGSVDLVYSQAVLEHVTNLEATYGALWEWLRPAGVMSHQIDFRCHGMAPAWNGHWAYPSFLWSVAQGRRPYLLNRAPCSTHLAAMQNQGFRCGHTARVETPSPLSRSELARPFRDLTDEDLCTSGAYIQAVRD